MTFGQMIENKISGERATIPQDKELAKAKRVYAKLKKLQSTDSDRFYFELDGWRFDSLKCYRGRDSVHLRGNKRKTISIYDLARVNRLGFVRQKKSATGMVDFYTENKNVKSERAF